MPWIPFTAHVRVVPARGKRFEYIRDLQKIAARVYEELVVDTDLSLAAPGGGQHMSYSGVQRSGMGGMVDGMAIKPQIGQTPAQLQITGFLTTTDKVVPVHPDAQRISGNELYEGQLGNHGWLANPTTTVDAYATTLKSKFETALTTVLGATDWNVFRIDVAGVVYGDRGHTFP